MKTNIPLTAMLLPAISFATTYVSIDQALSKKLIKADVTCKGGLVLNYVIKNQTPDSIKIVMPAGWRMDADKENYQDVLVAHEQILAMRQHETKSFEIKGYCCEYTNSGPIKGLKYQTGKLADKNLILLSKYLNASKCDANTEQYAVWSISNNRPTSNITGANDSLTEDLRKFVASVKGEPIPWYTLRKKAHITDVGNIHEYPIALKARVNYNVNNTCYAYFYVLDSLGNKVGEVIGQWVTPGEHDYAVNLNVKGFKKGKYKMLLASEKETFIDKEFEI